MSMSNLSELFNNSKASKIQWAKVLVEEDECIFRFTISNWSLLRAKNGKCLYSPEFSMEKNTSVKWKLAIYPEGDTKGAENHVSVYLSPASAPSNDLKANWYFAVLDSRNRKQFKQFFTHTFPKDKVNGRGNPVYLKKSDLIDHSLLLNNSFRIFCCIKAGTSIINIQGAIDIYKIQTNVLPVFQVKFNKLLGDEKFSDLEIVVQGQKFKAHKNMLAIASPVFHNMLVQEMENNKLAVINISDVSPKLIEEMLRFVYTARMNNSDTIAAEMIEVADKFQIKELKSLCEVILCNKLDDNNACDLAMLGNLYKAERLKREATRYIVQNKKQIMHIGGFDKLSEKDPKLLAEICKHMAAAVQN